MYTNTNLDIIQDNAPYTDSNGVSYPRTFPKDEIAELFPVTTTECPACNVCEGYHIELIGETYTQVWDTRDYTQEEQDTALEQDWWSRIRATDVDMPRTLEDIIDTMSEEQKSSLVPETKARYDNKKTIRQEGIENGYIQVT